MVRYLQIIISLGILQLSHALLESIPLPAELQECYENRSYNVTPSPEMAMYIKNMCYRHYQLKQMAAGKVWGGEKLTKEGMNYINSLLYVNILSMVYIQVNINMPARYIFV